MSTIFPPFTRLAELLVSVMSLTVTFFFDPAFLPATSSPPSYCVRRLLLDEQLEVDQGAQQTPVDHDARALADHP